MYKKFAGYVIVGLAVVIVEEVRAAALVKQMEKRYNYQSVCLASLTERLELLESSRAFPPL